MADELYYGYDYLLRQPSARFRLTIPAGDASDTARVDRWLTGHFGLERGTLVDGERPGTDGGLVRAERLSHRILWLYGELLRASGMPCTEPGRILQVAPPEAGEEECSVRLAVQVMDNVRRRHFAAVLGLARELVVTRFADEPSPEAAEALLGEINDFIDRNLVGSTPFKRDRSAILDLANQHGVAYRHIGRGIVRMGWGVRSLTLRYAATQADSQISALVSGSKSLTARFLRSAGLPAPEHVQVRTVEEALDAARALGWPVVVKPDDRERSQGVTTGIASDQDLRAAFETAKAESENILVERHVEGLCHRLMVVAGELVYAVRRLPKGGYGNGVDSVEAIVERLNRERLAKPPWKRLKAWPLDAMADAALGAQGLSRLSVPAEGQRFALRTITSDEWGGMVDNLTASIHRDNARAAIDAARMLGLRIAGIDLITTDITRPWYETGAIINEVNFNPQFSVVDREKDAQRAIGLLVDGDGRIPVHLVTGAGDLTAKARKVRERLRGEGRRCHLTSASYSEDAEGREIRMLQGTAFERTLALTLRDDVEEIVFAASAGEFAEQGLAVDRLETVFLAEDDAQRAEQIFRTLAMRFRIGSYVRIPV